MEVPDMKSEVFRVVKEVAVDADVSRVIGMFGGGFVKRRHPAGWDILEKKTSAPFDAVSISVEDEDVKVYSGVWLEVSKEAGVLKADVLAVFGNVFRNVPPKPDNFSETTIAFDPGKGTALLFTFLRDGEVLKEVLVRK